MVIGVAAIARIGMEEAAAAAPAVPKKWRRFNLKVMSFVSCWMGSG